MTHEERLADAAATIAIRAAREWMDRNRMKLDDLGYAGFCESLRANLKLRLPQALADAREAIDARMYQAAEMTFAASIAIAGIDAAKESCVPAAA